ncbi:MAG TPA: thioredoxin family protein [Verrucomicrobiota bacterium]|nr:thioredoxin family protein [Verrucomicrobiota bacterium]
MKTLLLVLVVSTVTAFGATPGWLTSYDQALTFAAKSGRPILLNFTGSDWCGWCKKFKAETLGQPDFVKFASSNLILVELDFPQNVPQSAALKASNEASKQKFNVTGFPTLILVSAKGEELGRQVGYEKGGVAAFTKRLNEWMGKPKPVAAISAPAARKSGT